MKKIIIGFLSLVTVFLTSCEKGELLGPAEFKYEVSGTGGKYSVTLEGAPKGTVQYSNVGNGWTYTWTGGSGRWLYLSAQNMNSSGSVTVKIIKNGRVVANQTSVGAYVIATVSGNY